MALSLRLPLDIEHMIAAYSSREGVSKLAVIVQSIRDFFEVMENTKNRLVDKRPLIGGETRSRKIALYQAMQAKQTKGQASARAPA